MTLVYFLFGLLGAWAYPGAYTDRDNIFQAMISPKAGQPKLAIHTLLCIHLLSLGAFIPGLPVYSISVRYNLVSTRMLSTFWANMVAIVFPWFLVLVFYQGKYFLPLLNWSSLLFNGFINFTIPFIMYKRTNHWEQRADEEGDALDDEALAKQKKPQWQVFPSWWPGKDEDQRVTIINAFITTWICIAILLSFLSAVKAI
eukprot:GFYU01018337.1.p1 GENE.GFYU01018337.1~~GFYU01018337.1.p1  ORF type:complete len:200 (+),score=42.50 GFYU01018337.1:141-740(+)